MSRQNRQPLWRQRSWVAFAILALLLLVSTAVSAQTTQQPKTNETSDWDEVVSNPCNGDTVHVMGKQHTVGSQQDQPKGRVKVQFKWDRHGSGDGTTPFGTPPQLLRYTYSQQDSLNAIFPAPTDPSSPTFISRSRTKMISSGASVSPDNWHATFVTQVHRNGTTKTTEDMDCRGQGKVAQ